jgi:hypothetical protein
MILHMNIHQSGQWFACATLIVVAVGCGSSADAGANGVGGSTAGVGGSSAVGGTAAAGGNAGSGGTTVAEGTVGQHCSTPGTQACNGLNQKVTLICDASNTWQVNQTCDGATQVCDPRPGSTQGTCQEQDALCATAPPGQQVCSNYAEWICDAWAMKATKVRDCPIGACFDGTCADASGCLTFDPFLSCTDDCPSIDTASPPHDTCLVTNQLTQDYVPASNLPQSVIIHETYANAHELMNGTQSDCPLRKFFFIYPLLDYTPRPQVWLRIQVADSWRISTSGVPTKCSDGAPGSTCLIYQPWYGVSLSIYTDDPNAPPANVYVEASESELPACP